ncbi:MAG: ATP-binding protein [Chloroflexi bacterium]|nr:ATP-binding protein [Chloroflexota bacterium]
MTTLVSRLEALRRAMFVGRQVYKDQFQEALLAPPGMLPCTCFRIIGSGGIGKTSLLQEYRHMCQEATIPAYMLDAHHFDPTTQAFTYALGRVMQVSDPLAALQARQSRQVLLLDTCELLTPLESWLREDFFPALPDEILIVMAGREDLPESWRSDPAWQAISREIFLGNFSESESRAYLTRRHIPAEQHKAVLEFTHGHPLALSLVAETIIQRQELAFEGGAPPPDVVRVLLQRLVEVVPSPAHRAALETSAIVRNVTEGLLQAIMQMPDVLELFRWLQGLSFIEAGPRGLFPHDLARETLLADLRWRNPEWYQELHDRARRYYAQRLNETTGREQQRVLFDYIYLHRENPMVQPFFEWTASGLLPDVAYPSDVPAVLQIVREREGQASADLISEWLAEQRNGLTVLRNVSGEVQGFLLTIALHAASPELIQADPAAAAAWKVVLKNARLQENAAGVSLFRAWMDRDIYQAVSPTQSVVFVQMVRHVLTTPGLAWSFYVFADPEFWTPVMHYAELRRLPEADFEVGGQAYGMFGHDWRAMSPMDWLDMLAYREVAAQVTESPQSLPAVMSDYELFSQAVRQGLRDLTHPAALANNPLAELPAMAPQGKIVATSLERARNLQRMMMEGIDTLEHRPRDRKLYTALYHSYVLPAPTQEAASEAADVPFSTFRRHLNQGTRRVTELLWARLTG